MLWAESDPGQSTFPPTPQERTLPPFPPPQFTMQPREKAVRLQDCTAAQGAGDDGFVPLEVVHGARVEFTVCGLEIGQDL